MQSIANLPPEVLELIYADIDTPTLYSISQLNRHLHCTALSHLFQRAKLQEDGILKDGILTLAPEPLSTSQDVATDRRLTLSAIRLALFLDIQTYNVKLALDNFFFDFKSSLTSLQTAWDILETKKECTKVVLTIASLERYLHPSEKISGSTAPPRGWIDTEEWRDLFLGFLEEGLNKGCRDLQIVGGGPLTLVYCDSKGAPITNSSLKALETPHGAEANANWLTRLSSFSTAAHQRLRGIPTCRPWPLPDTGPTQLTSCTFRQELLLQPPFQTWTIHILNNSPHLTSLTFTNQYLRPDQWTHILHSITCPALAELRFKSVNLCFKDVCALLTRHSAHLRILELTPGPSNSWHYSGEDCIYLAITAEMAPVMGEIPTKSKIEKDDIKVPSMPMLEELYTSPVYFILFMKKKLYGWNLPYKPTEDLYRMDLQFPRLKRLDLDASFFYPRTVTAQKMDPTFDVLSLYIDSFGAHGNQSPLETLVLSTDPDTRCAFTDFFRNYQMTAEHCFLHSLMSPFKGIRTFRIETPSWIAWQESTEDLLAFTRIFPDVEVLEIVGLNSDELNQLRRDHGGVVDNSTWRVRPVRVQEASVDTQAGTTG